MIRVLLEVEEEGGSGEGSEVTLAQAHRPRVAKESRRALCQSFWERTLGHGGEGVWVLLGCQSFHLGLLDGAAVEGLA